MPLSRCAIAIATVFLGLIFNQMRAMAQLDAPPPSCHVTLPSEGSVTPSSSVPSTQVGIGAGGRVAACGTDKLWTMLPTDGPWRGLIPQKPGDFAYSNKLPWGGTFSFNDGPLTVTGKRLDGLAPKFTEIEPISWDHEFMGGINIPAFGCWEITGQYRNKEISFVVWVTPISEQITSSPKPLAPERAPRKLHVVVTSPLHQQPRS